MTVKFNKRSITCIEFNFYMSPVNETSITCEVDLLLDINIDEVESICDGSFMVCSKEKSWIFRGYELSEYFKEGKYTKIILVKI